MFYIILWCQNDNNINIDDNIIIIWRTIHLSVSAVVDGSPKGKCGHLPQHVWLRYRCRFHKRARYNRTICWLVQLMDRFHLSELSCTNSDWALLPCCDPLHWPMTSLNDTIPRSNISASKVVLCLFPILLKLCSACLIYVRRSQPVGILCLIRANLLSCGLALGLNGLVLRWVYVVHHWPMLAKLNTWEWS